MTDKIMPVSEVLEAAAARLNGCEYGHEGSAQIWAEMKTRGLVAVFGASDDLMEFRGAIDEEVSAYDGTTALLTTAGLFEAFGDNCKFSLAAQKEAVEIDALWCDGADISWTYETDIPHATFDVMENGAVYCRGIVFALADAASKTGAPA